LGSTTVASCGGAPWTSGVAVEAEVFEGLRSQPVEDEIREFFDQLRGVFDGKQQEQDEDGPVRDRSLSMREAIPELSMIEATKRTCA
jgi:hypothetical protein